MDVMFTHGAGLEVQKKTGPACRVIPAPTGREVEGSLARRVVGTLTADLRAWSAWWAAAGSTQVVLESPGEFWRPVYHLLAGDITRFLVNAAYVKQGPGRKPDQADARGLAQLRCHGRLQASVLPPQGPRDLRDLPRHRTKLVQERSREVNRVQGGLERANIKLAAVATDIMGVSGRARLAALIAGRAAPEPMAELAPGRRRAQLPRLARALTGLTRAHQRRMLALQLAHSDILAEQSDALSAEMLRDLSAPEAAALPPTPATWARATGAGGSEASQEAPRAPLACAQAIAGLATMPGGRSGAPRCGWPKGAPICGALARPVVCRPGLAGP